MTKKNPAATFGDAIAKLDFNAAARLLGRKGGLVKSPAKTAAVRENGRRGGRPVGIKETRPRKTRKQAR